ncbi:MAG: DUF2974 domain-containing protein [Methylococcaceae bacterium]|nr:DUF2974 domain-containing protein [Methylococcaceae bacterium]
MKTIKPYTTTLNGDNAYWMARLAQVVYWKRSEQDFAPDEARILKDLQAEDDKFMSVTGFSHNSAQAMIVEHQDYLCMAFRGTDEIADWIDNINGFPEKVLFGSFHRGFWNSLKDIWDSLYQHYLALRKAKKRPLFITGHSLGAAMATLAAAQFIHQDLPFSSVYTFGQPRTMTKETSYIFDIEAKSRFFRFQNNNDLVTRVPARLMGYSHVGSSVYISEEGGIYTDPGFWFRFLDSIDGAMEAIADRKIDAIEDHDMKHYIKAVKNWDFKTEE